VASQCLLLYGPYRTISGPYIASILGMQVHVTRGISGLPLSTSTTAFLPYCFDETSIFVRTLSTRRSGMDKSNEVGFTVHRDPDEEGLSPPADYHELVSLRRSGFLQEKYICPIGENTTND
jgi:hypothetical protein